MPKSLSKAFIPAFIIIFLLILVASFLINYFLASSKDKIEQILSEYLKQRTIIEAVSYFPPNFIILKNIEVLRNDSVGGDRIIAVEKAELMFSLVRLIANGNFTIKDICVKKLKVSADDFKYFPKVDYEEIINTVKLLGDNQILKLTLKDALLTLPQQVGPPNYLVLNNILNIGPAEFISCKGSFDIKGLSLKDNLIKGKLNYDFYGYFIKNGMIINNLEIQKENLYLKLWGTSIGNLLRLSGNLLTEESAPLLYRHELSFIRNLRKIRKFKYGSGFFFIAPDSSNFNVLDLSCLLKFVPFGIQVENLVFSFQGVPFRLKGCVAFLNPMSINFKLSSFPNQPQQNRLENPKRFDLEMAGTIERAAFSGKTKLDFLLNSGPKESPVNAQAILKNLVFSFEGKQPSKMAFEQADVSYTIDNNSYELFFKEFSALLNLQDEESKSIKFSSKIYDGFLDGEGKVNMTKMPFKSSFDFNIKEVSADQFSYISKYFSNVHGKLSSQAHYINYPDSVLSGKLFISEGYLEKIGFFNWLADFFNIPSLRQVSFNQLSANFLLNNEVEGLEDISLKSEEVNLAGYFNLDKDDLVSGKLYLDLSNKLLETSPKFKSLLRLLEKDLPAISFNFQISGPYQAMNFKWLESDLKNELQKLLPGFIERKLERKIEEAIASISASGIDY